MKYRFIILLALVISPVFASAHTPVLVEPSSYGDSVQVREPEISRAFYGELNGFPHTYEVFSEEPFELSAQVLIPDVESAEPIISAMVIKVPESGGRVEEITRLEAYNANWEREFEFFGGDHYRNGPSFKKQVEAGTYKVEVHTAENKGKYVLVLGSKEVREIGYFETIRRIAGVKTFFEKSQFMIVQSPIVYIPLLLILIVAGFVTRKKLKK